MTALIQSERNAGFASHPTADRSRKAVYGTLWSLLHTLIPSVSAALIFFVSAAYLAPSDFGHLAMATGVVSVAIALSPVAFGEALVQRAGLEPRHAHAVFWLTASVGVVYCLLLVASAPHLAIWLKAPDLAWLIPLLGLKVPFELLAAVPSAMIVRSMQFRLIALRTAIGAGVGAVICLTLLTNGYGLLSLVLSQVAVSMTICVVAFWTSGWRPALSLHIDSLLELVRYGLFSSGQRMLGTVRLDHLVAGALAGPTMLGLLVFAQRLFRLLADVAGGALSSVLHVVLASMQGEPEKVRQAFALASFGAAALGFPIFVGAALVTDDLVALFFAETWSRAASAAQIYCTVGLLATLGIVQGALIRSQGKPDWLFWYQAVQEVTTVLVIVATWRFGLDTMVTVIVVKTFLLWPVSVHMTLRILECSFATYASSFVAPLFAALGMACAVLLLPPSGDLAGLCLQIGVGVVVYVPILFICARSRLRDAWRLVRSRE